MDAVSGNGRAVTTAGRAPELLVPLGIALLAVAMLAYGWVGYYGSDDQTYASGAFGWLESLPYVGDSHWTLRHTVVVPIAAAFGLFGVSEFTLVLPTVLYFLALLALVYHLMRRYFDMPTAAFAGVVLATLPLAATQATVVVPDFAEILFCLVSLTLFLRASETEDRRRTWLVLAGVAAGLAWLTRETAAFFIVTYGLLFLAGYGVPRRQYFLMAAGFLAVAGAEWAYFAATAGDPLHRLTTDLATHLGVGSQSEGGLAGIGERVGQMLTRTEDEGIGDLSRTGNISLGRLFDPLLAVLANQEFMFLYYLAVPAIPLALLSKAVPRRGRAFLKVAGLFALVWFFFLYLQFGMTLLPRYYLLPTIAVIMFLAVALRYVVLPRSRLLAAAIMAFLVATSIVGIHIDNRNPLFAERTLAAYLKDNPEAEVYTDFHTALRGGFLYRVAGVEDRVHDGTPPPGGLFFFNPRYVVLGQQIGGPARARETMAEYRPKDDWERLWQRAEDRKAVGVAVEALGLKPLLPPEIYRRLNRPNPEVTMFRSRSE